VPGKVENWVVFIEIDNTGLFSIPIKFVKSIVDVTAANYTSCLDKLYILNPTSFLKRMWTFITAFIDPETSEKINMIKKSDFGKLLERIDASQLEQAYGGTLPTREVYWPPVNTLNEPPYNQKVPAGEIPVTKTVEESQKLMTFNPEVSDTRNLSVRQSSDDYKNLPSKGAENSNGVEVTEAQQEKNQNQVNLQESSTKKSVENGSTLKTSLPIENTSTVIERRNEQQPQLDQDGFGYEHTFGGNLTDKKRTDDEKITDQDYRIYQPQEEGLEISVATGVQKDGQPVLVGMDVNEASRIYSGRVGSREGDVVLEKEAQSGGPCGLCNYSKNNSKGESCNIF